MLTVTEDANFSKFIQAPVLVVRHFLLSLVFVTDEIPISFHARGANGIILTI